MLSAFAGAASVFESGVRWIRSTIVWIVQCCEETEKGGEVRGLFRQCTRKRETSAKAQAIYSMLTAHLFEIRIRLQLSALRIASRAKEAITEHHVLYVTHAWVVENIGIDEEEHGQVHFFVCQQSLLLETEALNLGKVGRDLSIA